ncbi:MAG: hypothetical protein ACRC8W_02685 [Plesiomonas shigelloides]
MKIYRATGICISSKQHQAANVMAKDAEHAKYLAQFSFRDVVVVGVVK